MRVVCVSKNDNCFKSNKFAQADLGYKKLLQKGLKDSYGLSVKIEDLKPVAGPNELWDIITRLKPWHYEIGNTFRANFHIHTNASDGSFTAEEFLDACKDWADSVFKKKNLKTDIPPFSASITDHDSVDNVKKALALISQNPDKYKNFKFVTGCEFLFNGYKKPYSAFEAVGLGFNPFDENIEPMTQFRVSKNNVSDVEKVIKAGGILSWAHPVVTPDKINDDFFNFLKSNGINGVEGNYQYEHWDSEYVDPIIIEVNELIKKHNMFSTGGTDSHRKSIFK